MVFTTQDLQELEMDKTRLTLVYQNSYTEDVTLQTGNGFPGKPTSLEVSSIMLEVDDDRRSAVSARSMTNLNIIEEMSCCKSYMGKNNEYTVHSNLPECWFRFTVITTILVVYMCIGAGVFCAIERENEKTQSAKLKDIWVEFQKKHRIPDNLMTVFLDEHYKACELGDHGHENNNVQWDYVSSLFFTGTILTTIGYGHSSPATLGGRLFAVVFAIAGIPFMLGLLNVVAEILLTTLRLCRTRICRTRFFTKRSGNSEDDLGHHEVFLSSLTLVAIVLLLMTLLFKAQESTWSYEQSFYFSFITMTTIGFGDYVPAQVNVDNNSPTLISREFFNMVLIFISVLVWYFLSQVTAQVLKVYLKSWYSNRIAKGAALGPAISRPELQRVLPVEPNTNNHSLDRYSEASESGAGFSVLDRIEDEGDDEEEEEDVPRGYHHRSLISLDSIPSSTSSSTSARITSEGRELNLPAIVITGAHVVPDPHQICLEIPDDSGKGSSDLITENRSNGVHDSSSSAGDSDSLGSSSSSPSSMSPPSKQNRRHTVSCGDLHKDCAIRPTRSLHDLVSKTPEPKRRHTEVSRSTQSIESYIHTEVFEDLIGST